VTGEPSEKGGLALSDEIVQQDVKGGICTLTINRPGIMNAFNGAMGGGLLSAFETIASTPEIRVVVLQGGGAHFCSGADMHLLHQGADPPQRLEMMKRLSRLIISMRELPQPIICKVRGVAYGVGLNLALAGDFVIAAHDARLCQVFVHIGVIMDGGGHYFLPRLVGLAKARELAMLGEEISGQTAASVGLIYRTVPAKDLDGETEALTRKLALKSPAALALIKAGIEGSLDMTLREVLEWEAPHQSIMLQTREHKEAVLAFLKLRGKAT
jgi:2-(1,2-epoxy-1,2-dihydrophenyl)acetyl-CoA isomerase